MLFTPSIARIRRLDHIAAKTVSYGTKCATFRTALQQQCASGACLPVNTSLLVLVGLIVMISLAFVGPANDGGRQIPDPKTDSSHIKSVRDIEH